MSYVGKLDTEEVCDFWTEVNVEFVSKELLKLSFDFGIDTEVYEVVNEEAEV